MKAVAACKKISSKHLVHSAEFNVGRAYFQGYGIRTDYPEAERYVFQFLFIISLVLSTNHKSSKSCKI